MAADINKMTKFFLPLFRETEDPGALTKRILRQKYLDHAGLDKLSDAQEVALREAISKACDLYQKEQEAADDSEDFKTSPETNKKRKLPKSSKSDSRKPSAKKSKKKDHSSDDDDFKPSKGKNKTAVKKAVAVKNTSKKKTPVVKAAESSSEDEVLVKKQPEKKSVPIKSVKPHSEDTSDDEVLVKAKGDVKKDDKPAEKDSDQDELESTDEEPDKNKVEKESPPSKAKGSDSDSEEELKSAGDTNGKQIQHKVEKKPTIKKPKTKKTESSDEKEDSDIEKMKGYVRAAGIRITKYSKLFEDCVDKTAKLNKLKSVLEEAGLKGRPSMKACQKIKKTRETAKEVAELDVENILEGSSGRTRRKKPEIKKTKKEETKTKVPDENGKNVFARLQDIVDSD